MFQDRCAGPVVFSCPFGIRRLLLLIALALLVGGGGPLAAAETAGPWEAGPFAADPAAVIEAASQVEAGSGEGGVIVLFAETRYSFEADGRANRVRRRVYRILNAGAAPDWSSVEQRWSPWRQERPQLKARVITPDGAVHALDPATITEAGVAQEPELFEDDRLLRAPLPAAGPGAVVELEVTLRDTAPFFDRGTVRLEPFRFWVPIRHARLVLEAPAGLPVRHVVRQLPADGLREETVDGRRRLTFEYRGLTPYDDIEPGLPPDVRWLSYVAFSTGTSWAEVAQSYAEVVEEAIGKVGPAPELQAFLRSAGVPAASQRETIDRLLARLGAEVRYTGVELGSGSLIPRPPAETLRRKFGDCKDKAVLLTALLRSLQIPAHVALLKAGEQQEEIEESLPGMGDFNHAIVVVPGTPALWIDPTDKYARAGELPVGDQGRLALIASPTTDGLVRTPEATAADNREVETREFFLSDLGLARVVETSEYWGAVEREQRAFYETRDAKAVRESLVSYVDMAYLSDKLGKLDHSDPVDLANPFRIHLEVEEAKRGFTETQTAGFALFPGAAMLRLPAELSAPDDEEETKPRKSDYYLTRPFSSEIRYRAVPPAGFRPQPPPPGRVRHFGPATLSEEYTAQDDGTLTATLRFEIDKRRLTPEEFQALRTGLREVSEEGAVLLQFEQAGEALLAAGQVREALDELRRLAVQSPQKALPHTRLARALLAGGMGESAREEAKRAVALEPSFAPAHRDLAWILQHDEVGRRFGEGFDRAGAIAAYRKAKELDPKDWAIRADLAILLEHDEKGRRYASGADLAAAVDEYRALRADLDQTALDDNLLIALMQAGRFAEMKELLADLDETDSRSILRLVAVSATEGAEAAVRLAERKISDGEKRRGALAEAAGSLIQARRYAEAAALLERASRQASDAAETLARVELLKKTRRHEEVTLSRNEPAYAAKRFFFVLASEPIDAEKVLALFSRASLQELGTDEASRRELTEDLDVLPGLADVSGLPSDVALDIALAAFRETVTGDDAVGYKVVLATAFTNNASMEFFIVPEDGEYRIAGFSFGLDSLGTEALRRLKLDDLRGARQWLDWAREQVSNAAGDDPLATHPFVTLWTQGAEASADEARCAAASLLAGTDRADKALPLLLSCRDQAPAGARRTALDLALADAYGSLKRNADLAETARSLAAAVPGSRRADAFLHQALWGLERWDEVRQLAERRLAAAADDPMALNVLYALAARQGDLEEAARCLQKLVDSGKADDAVFNNLAWLALVRGKVDDQAIEHGQRAATLEEYGDPKTLHTLASLYAELGKTAEAYQLILQGLAVRPGKSPEPDDWYIFGRLAEHYGLPEVARRYYARVKPPEPGEGESLSTYLLARQRLAALGPEAKEAKQAQQ